MNLIKLKPLLSSHSIIVAAINGQKIKAKFAALKTVRFWDFQSQLFPWPTFGGIVDIQQCEET